jgi:hypothetical protein
MPEALGFVDSTLLNHRNAASKVCAAGHERHQFADSHEGLSPAAIELAVAIDNYKMQHRRRFITYEEILGVIESLGYRIMEEGQQSLSTFIDRRDSSAASESPGQERRQFAHKAELSPPASMLGMAIDGYKLRHRRRCISYEEMLGVIRSLGYERGKGLGIRD